MKKIISRIRLCIKSFFASSTPNKVIAALFGVAVLAVVGLLVLGQASVSTARAKQLRIVTIYDGNKAGQTIITSKTTVAGALGEAKITLSKGDQVSIGKDAADASSPNSKLGNGSVFVSISRARPVLVVDGTKRSLIYTAEQDKTQLAKMAAIHLYAEDDVTFSPITTVAQYGAGIQMTVVPAKVVNLDLYGHELVLRTQAKTVAQLLKEKNIKVPSDGGIDVAMNATITDNMAFRIWKDGLQTISQVEPVPFSTQKVSDSTKAVGYDQITTPGVNGQQTCIYQINLVNGQEISRNQLNCVVTTQAITQVETIGTKVLGSNTTPTQNEALIWTALTGNGFTARQTAGIMGNLQQEHGFQTSGQGLAQWGTEGFLKYSDPYNINTQINYLLNDSSWGLNAGRASVKNRILSTSTIEDAEQIFETYYEACGACMHAQRIQYAYDIYVTFTGTQP